MKVTALGLYLKKTDGFGVDDGGTVYGNRLAYPAVKAAELLKKSDIHFFSEAELPPEQADAVFCVDLNQELWERIRKLPGRVRKFLQCCESPIYAPLSHFANGVLSDPLWSGILTWNRSFEGENLFHYDLPAAGVSASGTPDVHPPDPARLQSVPGAVVSSFKHHDIRGLVPYRDQIFMELTRLGVIDLYGVDWKPCPEKHIFGPSNDKLSALAGHSFGLVIENIIAPGYVTEKLPDCLLAGLPVIYHGDFVQAQRCYPGTFVPLEELTVPAVLRAREQLFSRYGEFFFNVMKARAESGKWCDSHLTAISQMFRQASFSI